MWLDWINLVAYGLLAAGVLFLIWSLVRGSVSVIGLALLIAGLLLELLAWFMTGWNSESRSGVSEADLVRNSLAVASEAAEQKDGIGQTVDNNAV